MQRLKHNYELADSKYESVSFAMDMYNRPVHARGERSSLAAEVLGLDELKQPRPSKGDVDRLLKRIAMVDAVNRNILELSSEASRHRRRRVPGLPRREQRRVPRSPCREQRRGAEPLLLLLLLLLLQLLLLLRRRLRRQLRPSPPPREQQWEGPLVLLRALRLLLLHPVEGWRLPSFPSCRFQTVLVLLLGI